LQKVPETILSRCQVFEFRTITLKKIFEQLRHIADAEKVEVSDAALLAIARAGDGSMRDAESALDQVISFAGKKINDDDVSDALGLVDVETLNETMSAIADQDSARILRIVDEVVSRGYDIRNFCRELMVHTRGLLVVKVAGFDAELVQMAQSEGDRLRSLADAFSEQDLMRFFAVLTKTEQDIRTSSQPRFQLEIGLIKLAHARRLYLLEEALGQIAELQSKLGVTGATVSGGAGLGPSAPTSAKAGGPSFGASRPRSTPRAAQEPSAEPSRPAPRAQTVPAGDPIPQQNPAVRTAEAEGRSEALPNPFARQSRPSPASSRASSNALRQAEPPAPPAFDEPFEIEHDLPPKAARPSASAGLAGKAAVDAIKKAIEDRRKMMLLSALDHAQSIEVDGDYLRITFAPDSAVLKNQLESKDNRKVIEEVSREVVGRRLTLSASVGAQPKEEAAPQKRASAQKKKAQDDPRISALTEKFRGEVIEVKNADS
jgi:DNA polymerase III subunit gamma/tau